MIQTAVGQTPVGRGVLWEKKVSQLAQEVGGGEVSNTALWPELLKIEGF